MAKSIPYARAKSSTVGEPVVITPPANFKASILVLKTVDENGNDVMRFAIYATKATPGTFTPTGPNYYIVDYPDFSTIDLDEVRAVIANSDPNLPPGPPPWG